MAGNEDNKGSEVYVHRLGVVYMILPEAKSDAVFPCWTFNYHMRINTAHLVTANIAAGMGVNRSSDRFEPVHLLRLLQQLGGDSRDGVIKCEFRESISSCGMDDFRVSDRDTVIFRGYITGLHISAKTFGTMGMMATVDCCGPSGRLLSIPNGMFIHTDINWLRSKLTGKFELDTSDLGKDAAVFNINRDSLTSMVRQLLNGDKHSSTSGDNSDLRDLLAYCVSLLRADFTFSDKMHHGALGAGATKDEAIMESIGSGTKLEESYRMCTDSFMKVLCSKLCSSLTGGATVLDTLVKVLSSDEFLLQLVPCWSCDEENDFRMRLSPVTAWADDEVCELKLDSSLILGMQLDVGSLLRINQPDAVFVANYDLAPFTISRFGKGPIQGTAASTKDMAAILEDLSKKKKENGNTVSSEDIASLLSDDSRIYKLRLGKMPTWMQSVIRSSDADMVDISGRPSEDSGSKGVSSEAPIKKSGDSGLSGNVLKDQIVLQGMEEYASRYARALLVHHYLSSDSIKLNLDPCIRFGNGQYCLENMMGNLIRLDLRNERMLDLDHVLLMGELSGIDYNYSFTNSVSSVSYSVILSRARVLQNDADEVMLPPRKPIYKVNNGTKKWRLGKNII